ncbi:MAG TPA: zf-HC2 domain-containing protein [Gemmatimonadales bacterium]
MSHVDEGGGGGTLHAYLDGELPSAERVALEAHLAQCPTCRARLTEERALLERASALLGSARPAERPAPPFEQLRRAPTHSPWYVRRSVAWAASIAVALGLGYYLRNPAPAVVSDTPQQQVATAQHRDAFAQPEKAPALTPVTVTATAHTPAPTRATARASVQTATAERQHLRDEVARETPHADSAAAASRSVTLNAAAAPRSVADSLTARVAEVVVDGAPLARPAATNWPVISRLMAKSILGEEPVGLPGLATRDFRRVPGTDGTIVVEQTLDSSTVIQIFQRPAGSAYYDSAGHLYANEDRARLRGYSSEDRGRQRGDRMFARFVRGLRVEIMGPLSADSLNRLLEQVAPLP